MIHLRELAISTLTGRDAGDRVLPESPYCFSSGLVSLPQLIDSGSLLRYQFSLRPYDREDRMKVFGLLSELPRIYPGGYCWLDQRLQEVLAGKARCTVVGI